MAFYRFISIYMPGKPGIKAEVGKTASIRVKIPLFLIETFLISLFLLIREKL